MSFLAGALLAGAMGPAHAFELTGSKHKPEDFPFQWYMTDYIEDSLPTLEEYDTPSGLNYQEEVMIRSYCNWHWTPYCETMIPGFVPREDADCAFIEYEYMGIHPGNDGARRDGVNKIFWDDPLDELGTSVNAVATTYPSLEAVDEIAGVRLFRPEDVDITFNNDKDWGTSEDIENGCAGGEASVEATGTHEVGHLWGLGHSCEKGEPCSNSDLIEATMYWTGPNCSTERASIASDDIQGITALYGPFATFSTASERFGAVPLTVDFTLESEFLEEVVGANWNFGDGNSSGELEPQHVYTTQGQFTVSVEFEGLSDECGEWGFEFRELAYVLVCEVPEPIFHSEPVTTSDGIVYQMVNETDVGTYGCVDDIEWLIFPDGASEPSQVLGSWSPKVEFPEEGTYTVVMRAGGPAGYAASELVVDVSASGCSSRGGAPLGFAGLLLGLGVMIGRRRD